LAGQDRNRAYGYQHADFYRDPNAPTANSLVPGGSALVTEIEKAPSIELAAEAIAARVHSLKQAASRGLSRREGQP